MPGTDIDECIAQVDDCEHVCINQPGDYICSCMDDDYLLMTDGRSCQSTSLYISLFVLICLLIYSYDINYKLNYVKFNIW